MAMVQALNDSTPNQSTSCFIIKEAKNKKNDAANILALQNLKVHPKCKWSGGSRIRVDL